MQPSLETVVRRLHALSQTMQRNLAMNCNLRSILVAVVALLSFVLVMPASLAADVTWNLATGGNWDTTTHNWTGGSPTDTLYVDPDTDQVTFNNTNGGTITIQGGGVSPLSTTVSAASGTYIFAGGNLGGAGGLSKSGAGILRIGETYYGLDYTGNTQIDGGILRIDHNGGTTDHSLAGTTVLNGGTLQFYHMGAGHFNPVLTFTSPISVTANGGTIDFAGAANNFTANTLGPLTLGGDLVVSGITGNSGVTYNFTNGGITLNTHAKITNATGAVNSHTINLSPNITGATRTLTLAKSGSGTGFRINGATATSLNLGNLVVDVGTTLGLYGVATGVNPLAQIKSNGGTLTMASGSALILEGNLSTSGPLYDPTAIVWQGDNTLTIERPTGGNRDSYLRIVNANLEVSSASGLTTLNAMPWRAYYTVDSPYALVVGDGGMLNYTVGSNVRETFRGNLTFLDGATITGINSSGNQGGIIRDTTGGGTLTLGDGSASLVTVQGNHGIGTATFKIGFAGQVTENGSVTMRYANTTATAGNYFNVGWSVSANSYTSALTNFVESSGGTEFAPIADSGGVAVVGASVGTVASFAQAATLSTAGTVGFYNAGVNNVRGALGAVEVAATGSFALLEAGLMQASALTTISGSTLSGIGTFDVPTIDVAGSVEPGNSIGTLTMGTLLNPTVVTFASGGELVIEMQGDGTAGFDYDVLVVNGDVVFEAGAVLTLDYLGVYTPGAVSSWDILQATGTVTGFGLLELPAKHVLSFSDGVLTLTLIPEPTAGVLLACGGLLALRRRQRRG